MQRKIMLIDDEPEILELLGMRLKANGYDIVTASNGQEGLEKLENVKPDLIVLDVLMPIMDGFEFFKNLKKDARFKAIPVILLTARGAMKDTFEAMDADDFVPKPFDAAELVKKVDFLSVKRAMVLSNDPYVIQKVGESLRKISYKEFVADSEETMTDEARRTKYGIIVAHLPFVWRTPEDFAENVKSFKDNSPKIVLYCDAGVEGAEDGDSVAVDDLKNKWARVGMKNFFDSRWSNQSLGKKLESVLEGETENV